MDIKAIFDDAVFKSMQRPEKRIVVRNIPAWVKIVKVEGKKPKFKLSSTSMELIQNETGHVFFFQEEGVLYIASPGHFGSFADGVYYPEKGMESRIITSGIEMTKPLLSRIDIESLEGEWTLEFAQEFEAAHLKTSENVLIKVFKLVTNASVVSEGNNSDIQISNLNATTTIEQQPIEEAVHGDSNTETESAGTEHGMESVEDYPF